MISSIPILSLLIWTPILGGLILLFLPNKDSVVKISSIFLAFLTFAISMVLLFNFDSTQYSLQYIEKYTWIKNLGINYHLAVDGFSLAFILLTTSITFLTVIYNFSENRSQDNKYNALFLFLEGLLLGVFCALDSILFYIFFEAMLIPLFLIIGIWGGHNRVYATIKFFIYTLFGSVLMLVAILYLSFMSGSFYILDFYDVRLNLDTQILIFLAFMISFGIKIPMWPIHTWLPDAHVEAPTVGSVLLAAILLKMAGYGFIRFSLGLFPIASENFTMLVYILSLIAIIYTSLVALMQEDMKKLIAYSSVAHMGFVTLGIFTMTQQGIEGSIFQMISHGLVSAALFLSVGVVYERHHTRLINKYGGLVSIMPRYAIVFMVFTLGALGLPGTTGFIGEFLILMGAFEKNILVAMIASLGVILGAAYMLWLFKRVVFGEINNQELKSMKDLKTFEIITLSALVIPILFFGFYPEPLMNSIEASVENTLNMYNFDLINNLASKD